jgi:DUF218 domain-containing protein
VSSGDEGPFAREAHVLRQQLIDWGIAPERTVIDDQSRNTRENAVESARVARERGWKSILVVTSAYQRALGCFKAVGLEVDALPVDPRAYDPVRFSGSWLPGSGTSHRARTRCTRWRRGSSTGCAVTPSSRSRHIPVHRFIQGIGDRVAQRVARALDGLGDLRVGVANVPGPEALVPGPKKRQFRPCASQSQIIPSSAGGMVWPADE